MEFHALYILVTSMVLNFIVLGISLNRPDSFFPVSLSAISISLQGFALRIIVGIFREDLIYHHCTKTALNEHLQTAAIRNWPQ